MKKLFNKKNIIIGTSILGILIIIGGYRAYKHIQNNKVLSEAKAKTDSLVVDNTLSKDGQALKKETTNTTKKEEVKKGTTDTTKKEEVKKQTTNTSKKEEVKKQTTNTSKKEEVKKQTTKSSKKTESNEQIGLAGKIARTNIAKQTNQIILVAGNELSLWNKSNGKWNESLSVGARLGYGGLTSNKHEGDGATPTGAYPILYGFGFGSNPGTSLEYKIITNNSYFVDDVHSKYYNQWYEGKGQKGEHMIDHSQYKYGMVIGYNTSHTKGKGSAIFLHCNGRGNTAGCISVSESNMLRLLKSTHEGAYIIVTSSENNLRYY